jgi:phage-related protein
MIRVVYYREASRILLQDWLDGLSEKARDRCAVRLEMLERCGHGLLRPHAGFLTSGIYELRAQVGRVNYRVLYFFHGQGVAVVSHGFVKQRALVPLAEIQRALEHRRRFQADPHGHGLGDGG